MNLLLGTVTNNVCEFGKFDFVGDETQFTPGEVLVKLTNGGKIVLSQEEYDQLLAGETVYPQSNPFPMTKADIGSAYTCDPFHYGKASGNGVDAKAQTSDLAIPIPLTRNLSVGVIGAISDSEMTWPIAGGYKANTDSVFGGLFVAYDFAPDTRFVGMVTTGSNDTKFSGFGSFGKFSSRTTTFAGTVQRRFDRGSHSITPEIGITHAQSSYGAHTDVVFKDVVPAGTVRLTRLQVGATVAVPVPWGIAHCQSFQGKSFCRRGSVFGSLKVFHDRIGGLPYDPTLPTFDTNYFGWLAGFGGQIPISQHVSAGADANWFRAGDIGGWGVKAFVNFDIYGLIGKPRPKPLLERLGLNG